MLDIPKLSNKPAVIRSFYAALSHQKSSGIHINNKLRGGARYLYANTRIKIHTSRLLAAYFIALLPYVAGLNHFSFLGEICDQLPAMAAAAVRSR